MEEGKRKFWSVAEAAAYIPINPRTLYIWIAQASLPEKKRTYRDTLPPFRRFGRNRILIPIEPFKKWVDTPTNPKV